jgi:hypothetical protein
MNQLFDRLPDRLFSPLASANRRIYEALLLDRLPLFFDRIHSDVFLSRDTVRQEIEERLAVMAAAWQEEADALPVETLTPEPEGNPAVQTYRRLDRRGDRRLPGPDHGAAVGRHSLGEPDGDRPLGPGAVSRQW